MPEELKRTLNFPTLLLIGINAIMGTGIFFLPAVGAREAGVASIISWGILSIVAIYISMCFAELASMFPKSGGIYEYSKQAFGSFPSFLIGWGTLIAGNITIAMLIVGAVRYLNPTLPIVIKIIISLVFIVIFNYVAFKGMEMSAVMLVTFAVITLGALATIIFPGMFSFSIDNFSPIMTHSWVAIMITVFLIAETFFGWETVTFLAEETKNPTRVIPKVLVLSTIIIAVIAMLYVVVAIGSVGWESFGAMQTPLTSLSEFIFSPKIAPYFTIWVYLSIIGSVAGWIVSAPRLVLALAKDKLFIAQMAEIHPKNRTPYKAIMFQTVLTSILVIVGSGSYELLLTMLLPLVLMLYSAVLLALVVLRHKKKKTIRPFRAPFGNSLPIVVMLFQLAIVGFWLFNVQGAFGVFQQLLTFIFLGVPIYFLLIVYYNPDAIVGVIDFLATITLLLENFVLPKKIRKEIMQIFKDIRGKTILEFGSSVGTLTMHLADAVGPRGKVIATDLSRRNSELLQKRLNNYGYKHVEVIHDPHQVNRVHPSVKHVDYVFSVGMMSYLQDVNKVLNEMHRILPEHGKLCFVEYVDFFKFLPNPAWLNKEDDIKRLFREAGFSVYVTRKKGLFWNYLLVYGFKSDQDVPFV
ncbi:amino acid permease [Nanoarchaeota archaeon]